MYTKSGRMWETTADITRSTSGFLGDWCSWGKFHGVGKHVCQGETYTGNFMVPFLDLVLPDGLNGRFLHACEVQYQGCIFVRYTLHIIGNINKCLLWFGATSNLQIWGTSSVSHPFQEMIPLSLRMASVMVWDKWLLLQMRRNLFRRRGLWRCVECIETSKCPFTRIFKFFPSDRVTCSMWLLWPKWIINDTWERSSKVQPNGMIRAPLLVPAKSDIFPKQHLTSCIMLLCYETIPSNQMTSSCPSLLENWRISWVRKVSMLVNGFDLGSFWSKGGCCP